MDQGQIMAIGSLIEMSIRLGTVIKQIVNNPSDVDMEAVLAELLPKQEALLADIERAAGTGGANG
jgi:hypothetical protein